MEALPPILIGVSVAAVVAVVVHRLLRRRFGADATDVKTRVSTPDIAIVALGVLLMAGSLFVGTTLLSVDEPPRGELYKTGVGIAPAPKLRPDPERGSGFVVGLAATFKDCDEPVDVTIVFAGTAEYFEANEEKLRGRTPFTLAIPGRRLRDVRVAVGGEFGGYVHALKPHLVDTTDWLPEGTLTSEPAVEALDTTSIRGTIRDWSSHLVPIVVTFKADWLANRGLGTCYLKLPPLVGTYSVLGAQDALGKASRRRRDTDDLANDVGKFFARYDPTLLVRNGVAVVETLENDVLRFEPEANVDAAGSPAIACSRPASTVGELGALDKQFVLGLGDPTVVAIREKEFTREVRARDCAGVVTLAEAGATTTRELVLLLIGATFSLGVAIVLEMVLDAWRRPVNRDATT